ncbi:MAG TPA: hypothetical protein PLP42_22785, partial [Acidobacteriota bacterium]|nr:hypothetical protein [Acidobacteriota bacterium]
MMTASRLVITGLIASLALSFSDCRHASVPATEPGSQDYYRILRHQMVDGQIRARGVNNPRVLEAMRAVPRHEFVPAAIRESAYQDTPLPIGEGQTISQPYI